MLSLTVNTVKPPSLSSAFLSPHPFNPSPFLSLPLTHSVPKPISAIKQPQPPQQQQLYQPFRPPPSPIPPQFQSLDTEGRLDVLTNRLGRWYEYAPLVPSLTHEGFTPSTIEEITGLPSVEQNRIVVAAKVRDSLLQCIDDPQTLSYYDLGGAEILYEIRLLSVSQRADVARFIVENKYDGKGAQELARAIKDFPRRRGDRGWDSFDYNLPGDCLAFMYYRQAMEEMNLELRKIALEKALQPASSESARNRILADLNAGEGGDGGKELGVVDGVKVPVVRMQVGEVAEATSVVVLPVCGTDEVMDAPWEINTEGEFGVVVAEKGWRKWVVLPMWEPVAGLKKGGVVVSFADARALPWRVNRWYKEEAILVVVDRTRKEVVAEDGFYMVSSGDELKVQRGSALKEAAVSESLGTVLLVIRPPKEDTDNELADEDWE